MQFSLSARAPRDEGVPKPPSLAFTLQVLECPGTWGELQGCWCSLKVQLSWAREVEQGEEGGGDGVVTVVTMLVQLLRTAFYFAKSLRRSVLAAESLW